MTYWLLVMAVVCGVGFCLRRRHARTETAACIADVFDTRKYHCVVITYSNDACEAVRRLEGQRFLSAEAPRLPLQGCGAESCPCRYVHYNDRREEDRRHPYGCYRSTPPTTIGQERRNRAGRRGTDVVELDDHEKHELTLDNAPRPKTSGQRTS